MILELELGRIRCRTFQLQCAALLLSL